jgi:hypothetical protein
MAKTKGILRTMWYVVYTKPLKFPNIKTFVVHVQNKGYFTHNVVCSVHKTFKIPKHYISPQSFMAKGGSILLGIILTRLWRSVNLYTVTVYVERAVGPIP